MKKRGIALSINFLIVIIIAIVVFGFGIYFANLLFGEAIIKHNEIDRQTREQIQNILYSGEKVVIPTTRLAIRPGDSEVFGLGILNVDENNEDFYITIKPGIWVDENGDEQPTPELTVGDILYSFSQPETIETNKEEIYSNVVVVPSTGVESGTHVLNVYVCHDNDNDPLTEDDINCGAGSGRELYDEHVHKVYIEVP